jgi:hypothetical protein
VTESKDFKNEIDALGKALAAVGGLEPTGQGFVLRAMADRLGLDLSVIAPQASGGRPSPATFTGTMARLDSIGPKQFMDQKRPNTDVERVACLSNRGQPHFKTSDISKMNTEAAQRAFSNASLAVGNADTSGYLTNAGKWGLKQITAFGEKIVEALPDRDAVLAVIKTEAKRSSRKKKRGPRKRPQNEGIEIESNHSLTTRKFARSEAG